MPPAHQVPEKSEFVLAEAYLFNSVFLDKREMEVYLSKLAAMSQERQESPLRPSSRPSSFEDKCF
jgi:hypothetical protein